MTITITDKKTGQKTIGQSNNLKSKKLLKRIEPRDETKSSEDTIATGTGTGGNSLDKIVSSMESKQQKIEDLADFLEKFYQGIGKPSLNSILSKLKKNSSFDERRKEIIEIAKQNDPILEKSSRLIEQATNLDHNEEIKSLLYFFVAEVARSFPKESCWLPPASADLNDNKFDLKQFFEEAENAKQQTNKLNKKEKETELKKLESLFYLACQWHLFLNKEMDSYYLVDMLHKNLLKSVKNQNNHRQNSDLINFLINHLFKTENNKECRGLICLLDVQKQEIEKAKKQSEADKKRVFEIEKDNIEVKKKLKTCEQEIVDLKRQISDLHEKNATLEKESRVKILHLNDKLSQSRGQTLKFFENELPSIQDVLIALERDIPKIGVAREYLGNIIEKMSKEINRIKEH